MGRGLERGTKKNLGGMITRSVFVWSQRTSRAYRGFQPGRFVRFRNDDTRALAQLPGVDDVAPRLRAGGWRDGVNVVFGTTTSNLTVLGDYPAFIRVEPMSMTKGRFLNDRDLLENRKVVVIGSQARHVLMGEAPPIGKYVKIKGVYFLIIGEVTSDKAGDEGDHVRSALFIPFSTFQRVFNQHDKVEWFALTANEHVAPDRLEAAVRATLIARHRIHPEDLQAVGSFNLAQKCAQFDSLFRGIRNFVWFVGTLTLMAGMLGVSNILLITVKERTREFGIRKALGATPSTIIGMVIKEALALTAIAGYLGIVAGVGVIAALEKAVAGMHEAPFNQPEVDFHAAIVAVVILMVSGVIAGVIPARHAVRISPVEALRAE
jgi:putative ABC transport system permease protein